MGAPSNYRPSLLPRRFPVGATYVVEGGVEGHLRVIARYVVCPLDGGSTFPICGSSTPVPPPKHKLI
jgi:hypothetical protein